MMRDLVIGWDSVVHLNELLLPSSNIVKTRSGSMGSTTTLTWDTVGGGASFCQVEVNKRGVEPVGFLSLSPFKDNELQ